MYLSVLEAITLDGRVYVLAGGADDGLTLMELLPNGRLLHRDTFVDGLDTALTNPGGLTLQIRARGHRCLRRRAMDFSGCDTAAYRARGRRRGAYSRFQTVLAYQTNVSSPTQERPLVFQPPAFSMTLLFDQLFFRRRHCLFDIFTDFKGAPPGRCDTFASCFG